MRISKKAEYALRALVAMARSPRSWQIQELSAQERIPVKFLEQILLALRRAGLLSSKRGVGGGYVFRTPASRITVGEVLALMDGPIAPVACTASPSAPPCTCPDPANCAIRLFMTEVLQQIESIVDGRTIEDLARSTPGGAAIAYDI